MGAVAVQSDRSAHAQSRHAPRRGGRGRARLDPGENPFLSQMHASGRRRRKAHGRARRRHGGAEPPMRPSPSPAGRLHRLAGSDGPDARVPLEMAPVALAALLRPQALGEATAAAARIGSVSSRWRPSTGAVVPAGGQPGATARPPLRPRGWRQRLEFHPGPSRAAAAACGDRRAARGAGDERRSAGQESCPARCPCGCRARGEGPGALEGARARGPSAGHGRSPRAESMISAHQPATRVPRAKRWRGSRM